MTPQDWTGLASVYRAGADRARGWTHNSDRQQDAEILEAQAIRCEALAWRGTVSEEPLVHRHVHRHGRAEPHIHVHAHAASRDTGIDDHDHDHEPECPVRFRS